MPRERRPYGSWKSPITSEVVVGETVQLSEIWVDGEDVYWIERRPSEDGRQVLVRRDPEGHAADVLPPPFNARSRVHEYGGGTYAVADGTVFFVHFPDQRVYRLDPGEDPRPLTTPAPLRYADLEVDRRRNRLLAVREDHRAEGQEPVNALVALDAEGGEAEVLVEDHDFFASPRVSPEGDRLAWLSWDHPRMPWDGTELWLAKMGPDGRPKQVTRVAGGERESVFQPEWSPDGILHFVSDPTGWWNLHRWHRGRVERLVDREAEFGLPQWTFRSTTFAFAGGGRLVCSYATEGTWHLALLDPGEGTLQDLALPYTVVFRSLRAGEDAAFFLGASPTEPVSVVRVELATAETTVLRRSIRAEVDEGYLARPRHVAFPTTDGQEAYGYLYRPRNRDFEAPASEDPPLLVRVHGGPTSATTEALDLLTQYWTSRGFAVLDLNYRGSTGYGRAYREQLRGRWGIADVDDAVHGARALVEKGEVDSARLAVRGGSAGGYTTLCALAFRDAFHAGASYYGVSDLEALARETHKFESRYLDGLVGPYPARRDRYRERSPVHHARRLSAPAIFFQGLDDPVVPPNQSERMVDALRRKGVPVAYLTFEGEQHGFRRAETIRQALEAELSFYGQIFGFEPADPVAPVAVENLDATP